MTKVQSLPRAATRGTKSNRESRTPKSGQATRPIIIVTGVSGAGKSQALKIFEDFGFYCIDNLPTLLVKEFLQVFERPSGLPTSRVALGIDIRALAFLDELPRVLEEIRLRGYRYRIIFLDASEEVLLRRFSETRHRHPLSARALHDAIRTERAQMLRVKEMADKVIDTSSLTLGELKEAISSFLGVTHGREMNLAIISFGYKFGLPIDADLVWDVRFLPNPNYIASLKSLDGLSAGVAGYVLRNPQARFFVRDLRQMLRRLIPQYIREGKSYLTLGVGCTGGRHRSVAIAHALAQELRHAGYAVREFHRDREKPV
ncbi:MAG: RNase adapter RapZ [Elusimicrobia bacterium]|nr:RNase adapter RapZ [Elusimicrobiota bacterium]